jgi:hypothetical protein
MRPVDLPLLRGVCDHLSHHGVDYYLAERDWRFGERLPARIESAIKRSNFVLGFLTIDGEAAAYVNQEIGVAAAIGKPIVPILEKGTDRVGFRSDLDLLELDSRTPQDSAARLAARLNQLEASEAVRAAICWVVLVTAGLLFLGRN